MLTTDEARRAVAYVRHYHGESAFMKSVQQWEAERGFLTLNQIRAVLNTMNAQDAPRADDHAGIPRIAYHVSPGLVEPHRGILLRLRDHWVRPMAESGWCVIQIGAGGREGLSWRGAAFWHPSEGVRTWQSSPMVHVDLVEAWDAVLEDWRIASERFLQETGRCARCLRPQDALRAVNGMGANCYDRLTTRL